MIKSEDSVKLELATRDLNNIRYALDRSAIVAIADPAGNIIHANDKFCEISKYSREELLGQNHRIINSAYHPKEFFIDLWKTISSGKIWEGEIRNRAKDGTFYWVYTTIVPFLGENNKPYEYVSIRYEITQRKLGEEQLKSYAARLEASNRELQDFASVAAHDLQEPLRKIQAYADRLIVKYRSTLASEGQDFLDRMLKSASRMQKLIDDLLTYSRVTSKAQPFIRTDLNEVIKDVLADLEVKIETTKALVNVSTLPTIDVDPSQIRQLFQNLISNAIKFCREGEKPSVSVTASPIGNRTVIEVRDKGIGFDEKYLDRIFTLFQRLHGRNEYEGTGVGLSICRKIAERHGGQITARSRPGEGATFVITLPNRQKREVEV